jgi:hypothetical protein
VFADDGQFALLRCDQGIVDTKLEFVVDLKAARTIGLSIPQSVLLQADDVRS